MKYGETFLDHKHGVGARARFDSGQIHVLGLGVRVVISEGLAAALRDVLSEALESLRYGAAADDEERIERMMIDHVQAMGG